MNLLINHFYSVYLVLVIISLANGDKNCYPRWLPGSKSRIRVTFVPIENSISKWERRPLLDFQSMSIKLPKDIKEILACDIDPKAKIQLR